MGKLDSTHRRNDHRQFSRRRLIRQGHPGIQRVLSDEELYELWTTLETLANADEESPDETALELRRAKAWLTSPTAQAFQVQLLTARRPGEVRMMRWANVDLESGWWTIPSAVAKNARAHRVPLTQPAIDILKRRREPAGDDANFVLENRSGAGSIVHRGKKAASSRPLISLPCARPSPNGVYGNGRSRRPA